MTTIGVRARRAARRGRAGLLPGALVLALGLVVSACNSSITGLAVTQATGTIRGTVVRADGTAAPSVTVRLEPADGPERRATTGPNGTYEFGTLEAGLYTVELLPPDGFTVTSENPLAVSLPQGETQVADFRIAQLSTTVP